MSAPLKKLRILDMSRILAGPWASQLLGDYGADVVKVEPPDGDVTRLWGAPIAGLPGFYFQQNLGKRNVCIDLRAEGAAALVYDLAGQADVVIENYRPGVMARLGFDYPQLAAVNPRLIMLSISGFGHGGPESHRPAYAPIIHAEAGLMRRQARRSDIACSDLPVSAADTNASLHGLVALLAALIQRGRTGVGQHIDIAMLDATIATDDQLQYDLEDSEGTAPLPNDTWETGAGPILVSADFRYLWHLLTTRAGVPDPTDKGMALEEKIRLRRAAVAEVMAGLATWEAVEALFDRINVAWGRVREGAELLEQPTVKARGSIVRVDDRQGGTRPVTQSPYRFSAARSGIRGPAPYRGEHNHEALADWLGLSAVEVDALAEAGVLLAEERPS